jgi:hypothetical protein
MDQGGGDGEAAKASPIGKFPGLLAKVVNQPALAR